MDKMLKLYKIVDGAEVAFPNDSEQLLLSSFDYSSQRMGNAPIITGTIMHSKCLDDYFNEIKPQEVFIVFKEERYYLKNTPTSSFSNTDARYKHDVEFVSERIKLSNVYFYDVVSSDVETDKPVSNSSVVTFSGNIREFAARLNYSLQYAKLQTVSDDDVVSGYNVVVDDDVSADEYKLVSFSNQYFEAVLQQTFELYGVPYYFKGKTIHFGWTDVNSVINETLKYGKDNSLLSITKSNANNQIINRCTGTGSADNISFYYPNNSELGELEYTLKDNKGNVLNDDFFVKNYNVLAKSVEVGTTYQYYDTTNYIDMEVLGAYFCKKEGDSPTTAWESISYGDDHVAFNTYINIKTYGGVVVPTFHHYRIDFKIKAEATINLTFKAGVTTPTQDGSQFFFDLSDARFVRLFKGEYSPTNYAIRTLKTSGDNISFHLEEPDVYSLEVFDIDVTKIYPTLNNASYALEFFNVKNISAEDRTQEWRNEKGHTFRNLKKVGLTGDETKVPFGSTLSTKVLFRVAPQPNLMPYIYRESLGNERFYNAENNKYLDENNEYYEFANTYIESSPKEHIQQFEDIKPSIEGVVNNAGLPINVFTEFAYDENDNDEMDGEKFKHPYFYGKLRKMDGEFGLNIFDYASEEGEMTISMIDGSCAACQFKIGVDSSTNKNIVQVDENGNLKRDANGDVIRFGSPQDVQNDTKNNEVWVALMKDKDTFNTLMPNATLKPSVGDKFVILHIELPREYVWAAEQKLTDAIIKHMAENNDEKFKFSIKFSRIYLAENPDVLQRLNENSTIRFEYNGVEYFYYVSSFSYRFKSDEALPEINVELSDTIDVNVQSFRDAIKTVRDEIINAEDRQNQIVNVTLNKYIRNDVDSTSKASIDFENGIAIANNSVKSVIKTRAVVEPTDEAIYTAAAVDERIDEKVANVDNSKYLRKDIEDIANKKIVFKEGLVISDFSEGVFGAGGAFLVDENGNTRIVGDYLDIRKKATFTTISVQELKHVGGEIILSPAAMVCSKVEEVEEGYKCYFKTEDSDGRKIYNEFEVGDQARCQTFNLEKNTYYWRLVVRADKNEDFIVLSKSDCDANSDIPKVGDNISQLGNRNDVTRQAAIVLSAYGEDAPSYKQYNGINSYSLVDKQVTKLSPNGNELTGVLNIEVGSTGAANLADFPDEVFKSVHIGAVNLLLNSGFTGDYESEELSSNYELQIDSELYSKALKHWNGIATISDDAAAVSGRCVELGSLSQSVKLIKGESYVISFKAKGGNVAITCGNYSVNQPLSADYQRYQFKFVSNGSGNFLISGEAKVCDLQLERGTIATDWNPSPYDSDKAMAEFQALKYMQDAIKEGDTSVLGGLILSSLIMLGNYKDGKMEKVNAGMSGIYSDDDDVAFWGGGTYEQAIRTITKFKQNPHYMPTEEEWKGLANFVVSHGGDAFYRGYIYALGGYFRGKVDIANGKILLNDDGSGKLANGAVEWDKYGNMTRRAPERIEWVRIEQQFWEDHIISFSYGMYFDAMVSYDDAEYVLPDADQNMTIMMRTTATSRSGTSATLSGNFSVRVEIGDYSEWIHWDKISFAYDSYTEYALRWDGSAWVVDGIAELRSDGVHVIRKQEAVGISTTVALDDKSLVFTNGILTKVE